MLKLSSLLIQSFRKHQNVDYFVQYNTEFSSSPISWICDVFFEISFYKPLVWSTFSIVGLVLSDYVKVFDLIFTQSLNLPRFIFHQRFWSFESKRNFFARFVQMEISLILNLENFSLIIFWRVIFTFIFQMFFFFGRECRQQMN